MSNGDLILLLCILGGWVLGSIIFYFGFYPTLKATWEDFDKAVEQCFKNYWKRH